MLLIALLLALALVTGLVLAALLYLCVDISQLRRAVDDREWFVERLRAMWPYVGGLVAILVVNKGLQGYIESFSHAYGIEATPLLYAVEGDLVSSFQGLFPDIAVFYFSPMYIVGYVVLLIFPLVAYLFAESLAPLRTLVTAYAINYGIAVVCYAAIVAYGPRNHAADTAGAASVGEPMFDLFPDITVLTSQVNTHTNVFPSLHTALSVTVLLIALRTHDEFPRWTTIAAVVCVSIVFATMYLGIHWFVDVIAGGALATVSVYGARAIVRRAHTV